MHIFSERRKCIKLKNENENKNEKIPMRKLHSKMCVLQRYEIFISEDLLYMDNVHTLSCRN